ncbi:1-acyl-sn-glycerol-3-phosphate acyltransferases [Lentzea albidocapillata subsp. violacea]|uniref:1-acyl-sn-glycerol-3-phosphate acyltransferases n=1 Tax=Lentzea albidocapillata subsp. violacea TaxID=128104 RepID=A0A1G9KET8_9PSEU|nr:lysophospholipid acyltransferase family protein [Lentzea albidocapillata]SDL48122.1 1-acyl-sn-glycerol-3-phosphate acyltransferases [Lentzea albidocapillata subsp. violacea]
MSHAWMPASPCGDGCVGSTPDEVGRLRQTWRAIMAVTAILCGAWIALALLLPGKQRESVVRLWFHAILRAFGVRLEVHGARRFQEIPKRGVLVASNHVSWLDELAIDSVQPVRIVAKKDIKSWPVLGPIITAVGTVYLDREKLRELPQTVNELATTLRNGSAVAIHAEGTTWCGLASGHYKPALFQAALDAGVPVRPIVLRYRIGDHLTTQPAFVGSDTLIDSIRRVLKVRDLVVEVHVLDEIAPGRAATRRELAKLAEEQSNRLTSTELEIAPSTGDSHRARPVSPLVA